MNRTRALPTVLEILDDGLRLYRRNLSGFIMVATAALVILALSALAWSAFVRTQLGITTEWVLLQIFGLLVMGYPLILYTFAALSRATATALDGNPITLPSALRLNPGRGCGMIFFNMLFGFIATICAGVIAIAISCPMLYLSVLGGTLVTALYDAASSSAGLALVAVISQLSVLWWLISFGGWLVSVVYALQTFVLERHGWGVSAGRSVDLLTARFGRSLLMFISAGTIFGTLSLSYLGSLFVLLGIVQERLGFELSPLVGDVLLIIITVASLVVLLPPLSIWMAMFHRTMAHEQDGEELTRRVVAWHTQFLS
jgi:hypothetical protein